jgi:hypothetical protein
VKITVNVECSPEEARAFMGLPDVGPLQERLMGDLENRLSTNLQAMTPESLLSVWLPAGLQGAEQIHKMFWSHMQSVLSGMGGTVQTQIGGPSSSSSPPSLTDRRRA